MRRFALSSLFGLAALAAVAGSTLAAPTEAATPPPAPQAAVVSAIPGAPSAELPPEGECRIFFDHVPAERQPASMECEHALWLAHSWGGRVVTVHGLEAQLVAAYSGRNDFTDVPADALPERGYCRAWLDGVAPAQQPASSDCIVARRIAAARNGRVLFMPL